MGGDEMKRTIAGLAAAALWLAAAGDAQAEQGNALIESKSEGQVVMNARTFRVSAATVLETEEGARLSFAELPTKAEGASDDAAAAWYEASDDERAPVLSRLKLTGGLPD
jgi:hypothetical protein